MDRGLIPAHAGKTLRSARLSWPIWAHPRSRGENNLITIRRETSCGSSPLTRGKLTISSAWLRPWGLIPAHAGKTLPQVPSQVGVGAHPRSRGENGKARSWLCTGGGSSPLTRGKLLQVAEGERVHGLIPAHAGKTMRSRCWPRQCTAHPRSRGENTRTGVTTSE